MAQDFTGKVALVTGASRGIGRAAALALSKAGAHVVALARTQGALEELDDEAQSYGAEPLTLLVQDLRRLDKLDAIGPALFERFGKLDIFIGNAGMLGTLTPMTHADPKMIQKVMDVNVMANYRLLRTLDPLLRASEAGRVVLTGSGTAYRPKAYWGPYRMSKAAVHMLGQTYAAECEASNIKVNILDPGPVETEMLAEAYPGGYPDGDERKVGDIVPTILSLCSTDCDKNGEIVAAA